MNPFLLKVVDKPVRQEFSYSDNFWINSEIHRHTRKMDPVYYLKNRNAKEGKIGSDILLGKKGEFATAWFLASQGFPRLLPDLRILPPYKKGWEADLPYKTMGGGFPNVHVKACRLKDNGVLVNLSWVFQFQNKDGKCGRDALLNTTSYDLVAFVAIWDSLDWKAYIMAVLPWIKLKPYLRDPIMKDLVGIKKCIYYEDLIRDKITLSAPVA